MQNGHSGKLRNKILLLILPVLLLSACAAFQQEEPLANLHPIGGDDKPIGWNKVSFEITWPEDQEPQWYMDTLLADKIISPVLEKFRPSIRLWRFHRRAGRDGAGHRFSFIFYSSSAIATQIIATIQAQESLQKLVKEGKLIRIDYTDPSSNKQPNIEDSSDQNWALIVQKTWPSFIMGVSEMWLGLIHELVPLIQAKEKTEGDELYRTVQNELSSFWRQQGQHPLLHHLNALFGYEEMLIVDRNGKAMRF